MGLFDKWRTEDIYRYRDNKAGYHNTDDKGLQTMYSEKNDKLRAMYGMDKSQDVSLGEVDAYIRELEKVQEADRQKNKLLIKLSSGNSKVKSAASALRDFNYNPNTDAAFKAYEDMYQRQGQSAAKSTLNKLNSANMGRNSSYGAAATAQVQQAYAQMVNDVIPELAKQAYEKLLNQYNVERDMNRDEFDKNISLYKLMAEEEGRELENKKLREDVEYDSWSHGMDYKYAPVERQQKIDNTAEDLKQNVMQTETDRLNLEALPDFISQELEKGNLQNVALALSNENMEYKNKIEAIALEIKEKFGLDMAQAELVAQRLANSISQKKYNYM